ncbi:DUF7010 family protein [Ornithinimicrobium avium]|uniref:Uncharacterized protein n=1 Tax=Ornithinimicrobium avium TaxID=2283195 RepID=A0A345NPX1_9MICO|nr:hypothetical protein [Ornithinimicrobium avium]AXH97079.1 hypothetical protein DV701_14000 [Ornithinimicrobium avium]
MDELEAYLQTLAAVNHRGAGFLAAYGTTWLAAALLWRLRGSVVGSYAALFQGMVALPLALALTALTASGPRPEGAALNQLAIYLSTGQLLVLPLAVVLVVRRRHLLAAATLSTVMAVHLVPYSWLYRTPAYLGAAVVVALATAVLVGRHLGEEGEARTGGWVCASTGGALLLGASAALLS